jgi:hypothetical protein
MTHNVSTPGDDRDRSSAAPTTPTITPQPSAPTAHSSRSEPRRGQAHSDDSIDHRPAKVSIGEQLRRRAAGHNPYRARK